VTRAARSFLRALLLLVLLLAWAGSTPAAADQTQDYTFEVHLEMPNQQGDPLKFSATVTPLNLTLAAMANAQPAVFYVSTVRPDGTEMERLGPYRTTNMQLSVNRELPEIQNGTYMVRLLRQVGSTLVPVAEGSGTTDKALSLDARMARGPHVVATGLQVDPEVPGPNEPAQIEVTVTNTGDTAGSLSLPVIYTSLSDGSGQPIGTVAFTAVAPGQSSTLSLDWTPTGPVTPGRLEADAEGRGVSVEWDADQVQPRPPEPIRATARRRVSQEWRHRIHEHPDGHG
jgi:hypothetical protein